MDRHNDNSRRTRVITWAIGLGVFAVAVYLTFIYLVSVRGGG